jgi:ABC-type antimicrobial peptide transport system permease subunit
MNVVARAARVGAVILPRDLEGAIRSVDPSRPVYNVAYLDDAMGAALATRRLQALLLTGFAGTALVLAFLGIYSMVSFPVRQREREFGIRLAVGATAHQITSGVVIESLPRIVTGSLLGMALAIGLGATLRSVLFGVAPWDFPTVTGATATIVGGALVASYWPARRAARADPISALRND